MESVQHAESTRHFREPRGLLALWFSVLVGPTAWALGLNADYSLVLIACARGAMLPLHLVSFATLLLALAGALVGWRELQRAGSEVSTEGGGTLSRSRFMAALGVIGSIYFAVVIVAQWIGNFMLHPCMGI